MIDGIRGAYITTPLWAKVLDKFLRAATYLSIGVFAYVLGQRQMGDWGYIGTWNNTVTVLLMAVSTLAAVSVLRGWAQAEYVSLPLILGLLVARLVLGTSAMGITPTSSLLATSCFMVAVRYLWIHVTVVRARRIRALNVTYGVE